MQADISTSTKQVTAEHLISPNRQRLQQTGLKLKLLVLTVLVASFKTTAEQLPAVDVGNISELSGSARVLREKPYNAELDFDIQQNTIRL